MVAAEIQKIYELRLVYSDVASLETNRVLPKPGMPHNAEQLGKLCLSLQNARSSLSSSSFMATVKLVDIVAREVGCLSVKSRR